MPAPSPEDDKHTLIFSWATPPYTSRHNSALLLLASILNERFKEEGDFPDSHLDTYFSADLFEFAGIFTVRTTFSSAKDSTEVERLVAKKLAALLEEGISLDEARKAKLAAIATIREMQENLGFQYSRTELLGEGLLFAGDPGFYLKRLKSQLALQKKDIDRTINKWLKPRPFRILFVSG